MSAVGNYAVVARNITNREHSGEYRLIDATGVRWNHALSTYHEVVDELWILALPPAAPRHAQFQTVLTLANGSNVRINR